MSNLLKPMQRLQRLLAEEKKDIYQVYVYALLNGLVNLSLPLGIQAIINLIQGGEMSTSWVILVSFVIFGIALTGVFQLMQLRIVENICQRIFSKASFEFAYRIPRIKTKELYGYYAPELANRFFDTITIQKGLPKILIDFSLSAFQIIAGLLVLSMYHSFFIIFGVGLIAMVYAILIISGPRGLITSLKESKYKYQVAHWIEEIARTKTSFKLVYNPEIAMANMDKKVVKYIESRENHFKILIRQFLNLIGFKVLVAAGLLIIGSILVFNQEMNIGQFVAAEIIIILIISSVERLIKSLESIYDVLTALEKIGYITDMDLDNEEGIYFDKEVDQINLSVANVKYIYPNSTNIILNDISFDLPANQSVVLAGTAGSGKSTLISLLAGINDVSTGVINYNGFSIQSMNFNKMRAEIGFAINGNQIFLGSLLENITMGRENVTLENVVRAVEISNLQNFVGSLPEGFNTNLDPEGERIPRSVMNKIILTRAIASNPKLLILEDPLDHVPPIEKELIIQKLTKKEHGWNILVSAIDPIWTKYIPNQIIMDKGYVITNTLIK